MNCRSTSTFPVNGEAIALAQRHDQEQFPTRPIWHGFPASVQQRIKRNPFGAITLAAEAIADREAIYRYIDTLPIEGKLKQEIKGILILDYQLGGR